MYNNYKRNIPLKHVYVPFHTVASVRERIFRKMCLLASLIRSRLIWGLRGVTCLIMKVNQYMQCSLLSELYKGQDYKSQQYLSVEKCTQVQQSVYHRACLSSTFSDNRHTYRRGSRSRRRFFVRSTTEPTQLRCSIKFQKVQGFRYLLLWLLNWIQQAQVKEFFLTESFCITYILQQTLAISCTVGARSKRLPC